MIEEIPEFESHEEFFDWVCGRDDVHIWVDSDCMGAFVNTDDDDTESIYCFNNENPEVVLMWILNNKMKIDTEWC